MENNGDFKFDKKILDVKLETEEDPDWNYDNEFKTEENSPQKKQSKKRIKCEICSKTFNKKSWLKEHMAKKHSTEQNNSTVDSDRKHTCLLCNKSYITKKCLRFE